ncbi:hypothetical protein HDU85_006885 [Gaertneriomyces sp. JEL0708]|nr:hypothetical protein HDU85_006885 [Gaertneriomyces sp. JEL0708]
MNQSSKSTFGVPGEESMTSSSDDSADPYAQSNHHSNTFQTREYRHQSIETTVLHVSEVNWDDVDVVYDSSSDGENPSLHSSSESFQSVTVEPRVVVLDDCDTSLDSKSMDSNDQLPTIENSDVQMHDCAGVLGNNSSSISPPNLTNNPAFLKAIEEEDDDEVMIIEKPSNKRHLDQVIVDHGSDFEDEVTRPIKKSVRSQSNKQNNKKPIVGNNSSSISPPNLTNNPMSQSNLHPHEHLDDVESEYHAPGQSSRSSPNKQAVHSPHQSTSSNPSASSAKSVKHSDSAKSIEKSIVMSLSNFLACGSERSDDEFDAQSVTDVSQIPLHHLTLPSLQCASETVSQCYIIGVSLLNSLVNWNLENDQYLSLNMFSQNVFKQAMFAVGGLDITVDEKRSRKPIDPVNQSTSIDTDLADAPADLTDGSMRAAERLASKQAQKQQLDAKFQAQQAAKAKKQSARDAKLTPDARARKHQAEEVKKAKAAQAKQQLEELLRERKKIDDSNQCEVSKNLIKLWQYVIHPLFQSNDDDIDIDQLMRNFNNDSDSICTANKTIGKKVSVTGLCNASGLGEILYAVAREYSDCIVKMYKTTLFERQAKVIRHQINNHSVFLEVTANQPTAIIKPMRHWLVTHIVRAINRTFTEGQRCPLTSLGTAITKAINRCNNEIQRANNQLKHRKAKASQPQIQFDCVSWLKAAEPQIVQLFDSLVKIHQDQFVDPLLKSEFWHLTETTISKYTAAYVPYCSFLASQYELFHDSRNHFIQSQNPGMKNSIAESIAVKAAARAKRRTEKRRQKRSRKRAQRRCSSRSAQSNVIFDHPQSNIQSNHSSNIQSNVQPNNQEINQPNNTLNQPINEADESNNQSTLNNNTIQLLGKLTKFRPFASIPQPDIKARMIPIGKQQLRQLSTFVQTPSCREYVRKRLKGRGYDADFVDALTARELSWQWMSQVTADWADSCPLDMFRLLVQRDSINYPPKYNQAPDQKKKKLVVQSITDHPHPWDRFLPSSEANGTKWSNVRFNSFIRTDGISVVLNCKYAMSAAASIAQPDQDIQQMKSAENPGSYNGMSQFLYNKIQSEQLRVAAVDSGHKTVISSVLCHRDVQSFEAAINRQHATAIDRNRDYRLQDQSQQSVNMISRANRACRRAYCQTNGFERTVTLRQLKRAIRYSRKHKNVRNCSQHNQTITHSNTASTPSQNIINTGSPVNQLHESLCSQSSASSQSHAALSETVVSETSERQQKKHSNQSAKQNMLRAQLQTEYELSNKQYHEMRGTLYRNVKVQHWRTEAKIPEKFDDALSRDHKTCSSKTFRFDRYLSYVKVLGAAWSKMWHEYSSLRYRRLRFDMYRRGQSATVKILNDLTAGDPAHTVILWGDGSFGPTSKGHMAAPNKGLRNKLRAAGAMIVDADEWRSSKLTACCHTSSQFITQRQELSQAKKAKYASLNMQIREKHRVRGLLYCQGDHSQFNCTNPLLPNYQGTHHFDSRDPLNGQIHATERSDESPCGQGHHSSQCTRTRPWNRDINAAVNILRIAFYHILGQLPKEFQRNPAEESM